MTRKIGRNAPCPCGSGKKYKRCCGTTQQTYIQSRKDRDYIRLNREIAYRGNVGRKRQDFCISYIEHKKSAVKEIEQDLLEQTKARGETITCHKGCCFCCSQHVSASLQECEAIVYYLYNNEAILSYFLEAYPRWRVEVRKNEALFKHVSQTFNELMADGYSQEKQQSFMKTSLAYLVLNIPCPFLRDGVCLIYEVRPQVCACVVATTPAKWCSPFDENMPKIYFPSYDYISTLEMPFYRSIPHYILLPVPLGVYEILNGGFIYLSTIPGLEGIDEEVMTDPKVRPILQKYL